MCLYTVIDAKPDVAESDIEVYKVVKRALDGRLIAPYQKTEYVIGESYTSEFSFDRDVICNFDEECVRFKDYGNSFKNHATGVEEMIVGTVERGLHSFASLEEAKAFRDVSYRSDNHVVLRCVAGSENFKGIWPYQNHFFGPVCVVDSYASNSLKVIEEIV